MCNTCMLSAYELLVECVPCSLAEHCINWSWYSSLPWRYSIVYFGLVHVQNLVHYVLHMDIVREIFVLILYIEGRGLGKHLGLEREEGRIGIGIVPRIPLYILCLSHSVLFPTSFIQFLQESALLLMWS